MKKKTFRRLLCFVLAVFTMAECSMGSFAAYASENKSVVLDTSELEEESDSEELEEEWENEEEITANSYLYPFEEAVQALEKMASDREIPAAIYLARTVLLRSLPENNSEPLKELSSGDGVAIVGVGQDAGYNIWYKVTYTDGAETVTGYVDGNHIICVDTEFMEWQDMYIRSIRMYSLYEETSLYADVEMFPASYQSALKELKKKHSNWYFIPLYTNLDWNTSVKAQKGNKSLVPNEKPASWKEGLHPTEKGWSYATEGIIKYYMDPRNWLSEKYIFEFEKLSYDEKFHTIEGVNNVIAGTFMENKVIDNGISYAKNFMDIGKITNVSPVFLAARVRQEQGVGGTVLISGTYAGYEGYYNYYNIGATGSNVVENALKKAKANGWNTQYNALLGGARFLGNDYISKKQDTLYLQKFDLIGPSYYSHQYMQNIMAPSTEALTIYNSYNKANFLKHAFVFTIPVYNNMPSKAAVEPGKEDKITLSSTAISNLQVDSETTLIPFINGKTAEGVKWIFASSDPQVASVDNYGVVKALKAGETTITCINAEDQGNPNVGTCKVTVVPADIDLSTLEKPKLAAVTYDPKLTLSEIKLPEGYSWLNPDIVPTVSQSAYGVKYDPNVEKYNAVTFDLELIVNKRTLTLAEYTIPEGLEGGAGGLLSDVNLPQGFYWVNPQEKLADTIGTYEFIANYNPDSTNYETVTDIRLSVKVVCSSHNYGAWSTKEATCTEDGTKVRVCTICGKEEKLVLDKLGHSYESAVTKEATETQEGVRTYTCSRCGDTYTEAIPKLQPVHVHKYSESIVTKASCTSDGQKMFSCSCGDSYTEVITASGHKMENGHCLLCGYTEKTEPPKKEEGNTNSNSGNGNTGSSNNSNENGNAGNSNNSGNGNSSSNNSSGNGNTENTNNSNGNTGNTNNNSGNGNSGSGNSSTNGNNSSTTNTVGNAGNTNNNSGNGNSSSNSNGGNTNNNGGSTAASNTGSVGEQKKEESPKNDTTTKTETDTTTVNQQTPADSTQNAVINETVTAADPNRTDSKNDTESNQGTQQKEEPSAPSSDTKPSVSNAETELMNSLLENSGVQTTEDGKKPQVSIQLSKNTEVSHTIVEMAKKQGVDLEVELSNQLKWRIRTDSLTEEMAQTVDMNAQIVQGVVDHDAILEVTAEKEYMELSLSHDGEFGFGATLIVPVEEKYVGQMANLFYFNEKTGKLEFQMAALVEEDGNIQLEFSHASDYVIVFAEESMEFAVNVSEEVTQDPEQTLPEEGADISKQEETDKLLIVCLIVMVLAGLLAGAGYFIWAGRKEIPDGQDFEEWLKDDSQETQDSSFVKSGKEKDLQENPITEPEEYLDDDVDDYREKDTAESPKKGSKEKKTEEEYLDDDVDDYREKEV